ncbi:FAD-dependent oxidoreductase [Polaromonas sp. P1(28)-8]|nr:FAD-dependent oxidoreductase [Polaromonas sp. P1(28)-8]
MPNTKVHCLSTAGKRVTGLLTNRGEIQADHYVVANGVAANDLLRPLGLALPIYPIRGYSLTAKLLPAQLPKMSFTDYDKRVVYAPLGDRLRIAGMADIAGYDITPDSPRANTLLKEARNIFPLPASPSTLSPWCGLRPATPDGVPVFGATRLPNLSLNVGHGALGWTLAMATAHLTVEDIVNRQPQL